MLKKTAALAIVGVLLAVAGCDSGSDRFSKNKRAANGSQSAQVTSVNRRELP